MFLFYLYLDTDGPTVFIWNECPSFRVASWLICLCRSRVTISSKISPSPLMSLVISVNSTRMRKCLEPWLFVFLDWIDFILPNSASFRIYDTTNLTLSMFPLLSRFRTLGSIHEIWICKIILMNVSKLVHTDELKHWPIDGPQNASSAGVIASLTTALTTVRATMFLCAIFSKAFDCFFNFFSSFFFSFLAFFSFFRFDFLLSLCDFFFFSFIVVDCAKILDFRWTWNRAKLNRTNGEQYQNNWKRWKNQSHTAHSVCVRECVYQVWRADVNESNRLTAGSFRKLEAVSWNKIRGEKIQKYRSCRWCVCVCVCDNTVLTPIYAWILSICIVHAAHAFEWPASQPIDQHSNVLPFTINARLMSLIDRFTTIFSFGWC